MKFKEELIREFDRHRYLLKSDKIEEEKKKLYMSLINDTVDDEKYSSCLRFLSECLMQHYDEKVIILIDEYDVPLERAYFNGYYKEMLDFLRSLAMMKGFVVKSNREKPEFPVGKGRNDITAVPPFVRKCAVILEIKVADTFAGLEEKCNEALRQIDERKYDFELKQTGYSDILKYGVAFYRKDCMVKI